MITRNKSVSNVSYIQNETMKPSVQGTFTKVRVCKQNIKSETRLETKNATVDIKALALQVLQRKKQNENETVRETKLETEGIKMKQKPNIEDILYELEERISIMVFDGKMNETHATNQAFLEIIKNNFLNTL